MPSHALNLAIQKDNSIHSMENYLSQLNEDVKLVTLKLPRTQKNMFFKNTWISSLIATASTGRDLVITDWNHHSSINDFYTRFSSSLIGIMSVLSAKQINDLNHRKFEFTPKDIVNRIVFENKGLIEDHEVGKSFIFCSFDSPEKTLNFPRPLAIWSDTKEEFIRKFIDLKRTKIDHLNEKGSAHQLEFTHESDIEIATLVYELYENTFQHGRYDEQNSVIQGIRSVSMKRYASTNTSQLIEQAVPFRELEEYIGTLKQKKNLHFFEISISDNGIGIINRFKATRPDLYQSLQMENMSDINKLNLIIQRNLSSKLYPGSGLGIMLALQNLKSRKGFLSLRTGDQWVFFDGINSNVHKENPLQAVKYKEELYPVTGTHYNILIPIS